MAGHDEAAELVTSVGPLDSTVVLLREFLHRSGALRVVALLDRGPEASPIVIECGRFAPVEVDLGDRIVQLPHELELNVVAPPLPEIRQLPPFDVDVARGEVTGTIGGLNHLADGVRALARTLGHRNVAMAVFETSHPGSPLAVTARADASEPVVVAFGDDEFELPQEA